MNDLSKLVDAPVSELRSFTLSGQEEAYRIARLSFLEGRTADLKNDVKNFSRDSIFRQFAVARLRIREGGARSSIPKLEAVSDVVPEIKAEALNILAMLFEVEQMEEEAIAAYSHCYEISKGIPLPQKLASSFHNCVAAKSRVEPDKLFIHEFYNASIIAEQAGVPSIQGTALNNLSREYHRSGALLIALQTAHDAIKLIRKAAFGSFQYGMTLCNRAQIYYDLKSYDLAKIDLDEAKLIQIPEVQFAVSILAKHIDVSPKPNELKREVQTWNERADELIKGESRTRLTSKEETIIKALVQGPCSIEDLANLVYGQKAMQLQGMAPRIIQAVYRLKKKFPSKICFQSDRYYLIHD